MASWITRIFVSGSNAHAKLVSDDPKELERMAKRLHEPIHGKGNQTPHVDVPARKYCRALKCGAYVKEM